MFLLVPAYPGSPAQKAVKLLCVCVLDACVTLYLLWPGVHLCFIGHYFVKTAEVIELVFGTEATFSLV